MHQLTDEELVARYQSELDSPRARGLINELFGRHYSRVAAWCYRMTGDRESAADLAQEIFLKAFRHLHSFRRDAKFTTWLYTVTRNHWMPPKPPMLPWNGGSPKSASARCWSRCSTRRSCRS